ncbi:MAG: Sensor histidine kinase RcsC [Gemmatimonadaceae bacterium]|nr:Sensor histidine kinase RcsC [Gemmatimonadaceae bacterium]
MTLRVRLAIAIAAIALALVAPLLVSARSLRELSSDTASLRDREFAATLILGRMRASAQEVSQRTELLTLFPSDTTRSAFLARLTTLEAGADTLQHLTGSAGLLRIRTTLDALREATPSVYELARQGRTAQADSLVDKVMRPAIADVQRMLEVTEATLQDRMREAVLGFGALSSEARRWSALALGAAALLALLIAIWLGRSITNPLDELDRGMRAVADGDFTHHLHVVASRRDEFGRLAASYRSMASQLRELDRLKAEFISVASHDLNTPINVIGGYLQLLQEGVYGDVTPRQREILHTLGAQSKQLSRLVRQLLDVSRFEAGGGKLELRPLKLAAFFTELERAFRVLALQRDVLFLVHRDASLPLEANWDLERINEVLGNILSNAFKFTPKGGTVELTASAENGHVRLVARDTGAGIPANQLPYIFEKFYQADNQEVSGIRGTGLGLAIAKGIIAAHGGTISVDSQIGMGTTFTIVLPVRVSGPRRLTPPVPGSTLT